METKVQLTPAKQAVLDQTRKQLSKYTTPQLQTKLDSGTLMGMSKEVAEEILIKRKAKQESTSTQEKVKPTVVVNKIVMLKEVKSSTKKEKVEKKQIDGLDPKVKIIMENENFSKTDKIKELLQLGYTTSQISKRNFPALNAHPSFVYTVANKK